MRSSWRGLPRGQEGAGDDPEGTDRVNDSKRRDDSVAFLKDSTAPAVQSHRCRYGRVTTTTQRPPSFEDGRPQLHVCYVAGASGYVKHRDSAPTKPVIRPEVTVIYYLNPNWHARPRANCGWVRL